MNMNWELDWEMVIKLCLALVLGLFIGIDRQLKQKPLGIKTSMVIAIASCLITIVSIQSYHKFGGATHPNMDPMRLAAQIVSGVGFLGAGVILRRNNDVISGLTSAALIWAASGLGISIGAGFYIEAGVAVILLMFSVNIVPYLIKSIGPEKLNKHDVSVKIVMESNDFMTELLQKIEYKTDADKGKKHHDHRIRRLKIKDIEGGRQRIDLVLSTPDKEYPTEVYYFLKSIEHVVSVEVEEL